jgi:hypothetical protein
MKNFWYKLDAAWPPIVAILNLVLIPLIVLNRNNNMVVTILIPLFIIDIIEIGFLTIATIGTYFLKGGGT